MKKTRNLWFIVLPGLAMWLGWGLRGQLGHAEGAMVPGAFVALVLCSLLKGKRFSPGLVIALTAVGFGFGAEETTMQSAGMAMGFIHPPEGTAALGYIGLAIKGALWALFGAAGLGLSLVADRYRRKDIVLGAIFMLASFYAGWALINRPKLLYFSVNRHEIWGGLLFAAIVLLAWLTVRGRTYIPLVLALCGAIAGGIGYPIAVTLAGSGIHSSYTGRWIDWWKVAETTFGAFMGVGLGIGTYLLKDRLPEADELNKQGTKSRFSAWSLVAGLVVSALCASLYDNGDGVTWVILGAVLLCVAFYSSKLAWHIGVTLIYCALAANVVIYWVSEQKIGNAALLWTLAGLTSLIVAWIVEHRWWAETDVLAVSKAFPFLMWAIVMLSYLKSFIDRAVLNPPAQAVAAAGGRWAYTVETWGGGLVVDGAFTVVALVLTWMTYQISHQQESMKGAQSGETREALT